MVPGIKLLRGLAQISDQVFGIYGTSRGTINLICGTSRGTINRLWYLQRYHYKERAPFLLGIKVLFP